jgi:uncharacterized protein
LKTHDTYTAFAGTESIVNGDLSHVAQAVKAIVDAKEPQSVLVFADETGKQVDLDLRGSMDDVLARIVLSTPVTPPEPEKPRGPGRPKLGVVGREVTLLPRHWEWLNVQPGGASVVLRKLVEQARLGGRQKDKVRQSQEAAYRFMAAMAGNEPGFEEACRALFAGHREGFATQTKNWPVDVREFARRLAAGSYEPEGP